MKNIHECVSFLILQNDKILLEKRSEQKETDPGLIAIPGGHIEGNETNVQALIRELKEELNIEPVSHQYICSLYHPTKELQLIHYFVVKSWQGEMITLEADEVGWYPLENAPIGIEADKVALLEFQRLRYTLKLDLAES
ncbi:NUDIX hydrolase [Vibrio alginolyticus]